MNLCIISKRNIFLRFILLASRPRENPDEQQQQLLPIPTNFRYSGLLVEQRQRSPPFSANEVNREPSHSDALSDGARCDPQLRMPRWTKSTFYRRTAREAQTPKRHILVVRHEGWGSAAGQTSEIQSLGRQATIVDQRLRNHETMKKKKRSDHKMLTMMQFSIYWIILYIYCILYERTNKALYKWFV